MVYATGILFSQSGEDSQESSCQIHTAGHVGCKAPPGTQFVTEHRDPYDTGLKFNKLMIPGTHPGEPGDSDFMYELRLGKLEKIVSHSRNQFASN